MRKEYSFKGGVRGKFSKPNKVQKTLRIDFDVLEFQRIQWAVFKKRGLLGATLRGSSYTNKYCRKRADVFNERTDVTLVARVVVY